MSEPTKAATAAASVTCAGMPELFTLGVAEIIDRETGLPELIDSMQHGSEYRDTPGMVDRMKTAVQKSRGT